MLLWWLPSPSGLEVSERPDGRDVGVAESVSKVLNASMGVGSGPVVWP